MSSYSCRQIRLLSIVFSLVIDYASSHANTPIFPRSMISTWNIDFVSTRDSSRSVACAYAARRWPTEVCLTASLGSSILPFGILGDPSTLDFKMLRQTNMVATIAARPPTIPQYTHDIVHSPACASRESFLRTPSCRHAIHPFGRLMFHLSECFKFSASGS